MSATPATSHFPEVSTKTNLLGMSRAQLGDFFARLGEKPFRVNQIMKWLYHENVSDFNAMTNLSKPLRKKLEMVAVVRPPKLIEQTQSQDGTIKWIVQVHSGAKIESIFIPEEKRGTLCLSSQAGCALQCSFCATGMQGFNTNLKASEIIGQIWIALAQLKKLHPTWQRPITNVVLMGMGEPLLNFDKVVQSINIIMDDFGYGLSKRRVTLSTAGIVPKLQKLNQYTDCALAISLHAPNDLLRNQLVPINRKYPIAQLLDAATRYMRGFKDSRVITIEYTLIAGINDHLEQAQELARLLADIPCKINLIPFNPFPASGYQKPSNNRIHLFQKELHKAGLNATIRKTRGDDIAAACGQLVGQIKAKNPKRIPIKQITA